MASRASLLSGGCAWTPEKTDSYFRTLPAYSVAFSPDGQRLAGGLPLTGVLVVDARSQRVKFRLGEAKFGVKAGMVVAHDYGVPMAFSLDSSRLAIALGNSIVVVDPESEERVVHGRVHQGATIVLAYAPDGSAIVSGGEDGVLRFWNSRTYELIREVGGFTSAVTGIAISSNGQRMAVSAGGHEVRLFDGTATAKAAEGQALARWLSVRMANFWRPAAELA